MMLCIVKLAQKLSYSVEFASAMVYHVSPALTLSHSAPFALLMHYSGRIAPAMQHFEPAARVKVMLRSAQIAEPKMHHTPVASSAVALLFSLLPRIAPSQSSQESQLAATGGESSAALWHLPVPLLFSLLPRIAPSQSSQESQLAATGGKSSAAPWHLPVP
jgi:hypothetical protein